jgi:hypothetical protein
MKQYFMGASWMKALAPPNSSGWDESICFAIWTDKMPHATLVSHPGAKRLQSIERNHSRRTPRGGIAKLFAAGFAIESQLLP